MQPFHVEWLHSSKLKFLYLRRFESESEKDLPVMVDDKKKTEPVKPITPDILRKMAASGKSLPSVEQAQLLEERTMRR